MYGLPIGEEDYDYDRIIDARREAAYDNFLEHAVKCVLCGELWDPGYHRATRFEPAWVECDECPACGGDPE